MDTTKTKATKSTKATVAKNDTNKPDFMQFYDKNAEENFDYYFSIPATDGEGKIIKDAEGNVITAELKVSRHFSSDKDSEHIVMHLGNKKVWIGARADKLKRVYGMIVEQKESKNTRKVIEC